MAYSAEKIRLVHRVIGSQHVYTSPDVVELHVSHSDKATARASVQSALDMLERMQRTINARRQVREIRESERICA